MNFLKKGPEIKFPTSLSDVKVPDFAKDLYHELDERHLLPLAIVLLVAIFAVPIALSESAEPNPAAGVPAGAGPGAASSAIVVSKSLPPLRDYRKRLKDLKAKDPFKQQFADAEEAESAAPEETSTAVQTFPEESGAGTPPVPEGGGGGGVPGGGGETGEIGGGGGNEGGSPPHQKQELRYYSWSIDVRVVPVSANGKPSKAKPTVRRNLPELTMLPGRDTPAAIFIGPSSDEKKAMMLVSSNVTAVFGDAVCVLGGETCEMLALEKGVPETFVYGGNKRVFRIELLKLRLVETDKLRKAPLGKGGNGGGKDATRVAPAAG